MTGHGEHRPGYEERLQAFTGRELRARTPAQDPVNRPMIRHWAEAMGDTNPVYTDDAAARATGRAGVVAPASMVQAWTMRGYAATVAPPPGGPTGFDELAALLDEGGYTSVVATDSEFTFLRELVPGDHIAVRETVESLSTEKRTGLGAGRFVTTLKTYTDEHGETVATQRWRTLRFAPAPEQAPPAPRPRPAVNRDNAFFFEGANQHRLLIQRCARCSVLRHPPGPCCPECQSLEWDTAEACGHGRIYSFVVNHHPRHPAFESPYLVAVVELTEGTRLITGLTGVAPDDVTIGMPVVLDWLDTGTDPTLPVFRPAPTEAP
ncbi:MaoC family dehydratase N-terminal domain-containing protein [Streptomyces sp. NBC_00341]|uniref:bifunctional MaoC family dehydratase N-terminal/OB-fold nucleic acid binding domain-containing protein n=1 Tax=Streptomyces sp. NBC_00341 TaxID=2975717 RepID=UPI003089386D|nr:MaoC family dehydratase N-terminal domain-containing protein [Streptomyces sp. NBC_00341]